MTRAVVALGSNIGDRLATLSSAVAQLQELGTICALSRLYETAPIGGPEQQPFYNAVAIVDTALDANDLLAALHRIEANFDRTREIRWGPRTLDLDLILHGATVIDTGVITVPHPRYRQRRFVLEPLLEAWPAAQDPDGTSLAPLLIDLQDQDLRVVQAAAWERAIPPATTQRDRGGMWVIGQMLVLAAFFAIVATTGAQSPGTALELGGGLVAGLGVAILVVAMTDLGRLMTPFPEPVGGGDLVGSGLYGMVRHPMYSAVMLITVGLAGLFASVVGLAVWPLVIGFFSAKSRHEEQWLANAHSGYEEYRRAVPRRFVPKIG